MSKVPRISLQFFQQCKVDIFLVSKTVLNGNLKLQRLFNYYGYVQHLFYDSPKSTASRLRFYSSDIPRRNFLGNLMEKIKEEFERNKELQVILLLGKRFTSAR